MIIASLIELLVVVAIIGILAAVAIPAYNKYQQNARAGTVHGTLSQIAKAVNACLAIGQDINSCVGAAGTGVTSPIVDSTVRFDSSLVIDRGRMSGGPACFLVKYGTTTETGCVSVTSTGVFMTSTQAQIKDATTAACTAAGACTF